MKCPKCRKPAKINSVKIRSSPRKKKKKHCSSILKLSTGPSGRVQKRSSSFLAKPSIDSFSMSGDLYVTFPMLGEHSDSASPSSPSSPSSDESGSSGSEMLGDAAMYEFAVCSGLSCHFKFCVKCKCKSHPRQMCKELSPASPTHAVNRSSVACSNKSLKSLKRLIY